MNCYPLPEVTCGSLINDSCVIITETWPLCFPGSVPACYRQSDYNTAAGTLICSLNTNVTNILASIGNLTTLTGCTNITPSGTTLNAQLQTIYNYLCSLQTNLNLPIVGLNLHCLQDPCGTPIGTLGQLLQAIVNELCLETGAQVYEVLITQVGTTAPTISYLNNTVDPGNTNLTWLRTGAGTYTLTASGSLAGIFGSPYIQIGPLTSFGKQVIYTITSSSTITFQTGIGATATLQDSVFNNTSLLIKIY